MPAAWLFGGLALSVLALVALFPTSKGNRSATLVLAAPALILGVILAGWRVQGYLGYRPTDPSYNPTPDFVMDLLIMAGPSLLPSSLAVAVLLYKRRRTA